MTETVPAARHAPHRAVLRRGISLKTPAFTPRDSAQTLHPLVILRVLSRGHTHVHEDDYNARSEDHDKPKTLSCLRISVTVVAASWPMDMPLQLKAKTSP